MTISIIAAVDTNGLIGNKNELPWHLPADLAYFKAQTNGKPIIMGSATYKSIGRALPNRTNVVLSKTLSEDTSGILVVRSLEQALSKLKDEPEIFVIGGASVYAQALPLANRLYLTRINHEFSGDVYFPDLALDAWALISEDAHQKDDENPYDYTFCVYEKK